MLLFITFYGFVFVSYILYYFMGEFFVRKAINKFPMF